MTNLTKTGCTSGRGGCRDEVLLGTVVGEKSVNYGTEG